MGREIQILVVDDHQVVREGIRRLLGEEEDMELVGQGANSEEALLQAEMLSPDIVLMDIKMPGVDGIELTRQLKQKYPNCNVIMLTLYDEYLNQAMEAGARGYLLKDRKNCIKDTVLNLQCITGAIESVRIAIRVLVPIRSRRRRKWATM